ncbi:hypothetical protein GA0070616_4386 [Micromonospora nigra]|uniref:Uncharacterized protein n=1 Tax=Micromonospora nigra TaxID=145857 RepID=A0A1C6SR52_9ACTN|nr:hypothetical protein [Micromonospora nigra]SCL32094.1 hypothetical protein GA0070616_4386 [Micromonospora nigra]
MTDTPYTDADVKLVTSVVRDARLSGDSWREIATAALDILARAGRIKPPTADAQVRAGADALVRLRTLAPSLSELGEEEQSFWLRDAAAVVEAAGPAAPTPPYVHHLLDAFLTGQPLNFRRDPVPLDVQRRLEHAVATGQMGTVPAPTPNTQHETTSETHHVLAVANDGAWEIAHPTTCTVHTPTGPAVICLVHDLAIEQLPADASGLRAGRYEIAANDLGDRLSIGDRLDPAED